MRKTLYVAISAAAILISAPVASFAMGMNPEECPQLSAITAVGVDVAETKSQFGKNEWMLSTTNFEKYGTNNEWIFVEYFIHADNKSDAVAKGNAALNTLSFMGVEQDYYCMYQGNFDGREVYGVAAANPFGGMSGIKKMMRMMK